MKKELHILLVSAIASLVAVVSAKGQPAPAPSTNVTRGSGGGGFRRMMEDSTNIVKLGAIRMRDVCILPDQASKTYYMVGPGFRTVRVYTSKDLVNWQGPQTIFRPATNIWGDIPGVSIWAPEMQAYQGKYYLFLTFETRNKFPEQWRDWLPRVTRGSQVLVADKPTGHFAAFTNHSTLPADMMTLDGTLWVEDGVPKRFFNGSDAVWSRKSDQYGCHVTDGPYLRKSKSGKLFMIWTSGGYTGYTTGIAISDSGKLAGPWKQQAEPVYAKDGGHAMLFTTFDGKLMMVLHSPNEQSAQPRVFQMEDAGETLRIATEFTGETA
jgi:hypothetical protein